MTFRMKFFHNSGVQRLWSQHCRGDFAQGQRMYYVEPLALGSFATGMVNRGDA